MKVHVCRVMGIMKPISIAKVSLLLTVLTKAVATTPANDIYSEVFNGKALHQRGCQRVLSAALPSLYKLQVQGS